MVVGVTQDKESACDMGSLNFHLQIPTNLAPPLTVRRPRCGRCAGLHHMNGAVSRHHPGRAQGKRLSWIPSVVPTFILQRQHAIRAFRQITHLEAPLAIGGSHKLRQVPCHNAVQSKGCWEHHHTHVRHTRTIKCIHHAPSNGEGVKFWTRRKGVDQSSCRVALIHIHNALPKLPHVRRVCGQRLLPSHFDFLAANHQIHRTIEWRAHKQFGRHCPALTYSSNTKVMLLVVTFVDPMGGVAISNFGGVSSLAPPEGMPTCAQATRINNAALATQPMIPEALMVAMSIDSSGPK